MNGTRDVTAGAEAIEGDSETLRHQRRSNLKRLLNPRHIAFVGGRTCTPAIEMALSVGFKGEIWPVHPKYETLADQKVYPSVDDLPEAPDATFLNVSKAITMDVLERLSARKAGGVVCFAAGFAELGDEGQALQQELGRRAGALAAIGPNSTGFLNYLDGVALWPVCDHKSYRLDKGVAIVSASGGILFNYSINQRSLRAGYMIGVGNQAVLDHSDYVDVLVDDPRVTAIGLVIEDLGDAPQFSRSAARAIARGTPIVVLKTGATDAGARVAQTHSGALIADDAMVQALFDRCGVIRVHSLPELDETLKMLTTTALPKGRRLAVLTNSGGEKALAADATKGTVLELPQPSAGVAADLKRQIPAFAVVSNPFDYNAYFSGAGPDVLSEDNPHLLVRCFRTMIEDDYDIAMMLRGIRTRDDGSPEEPGSTLPAWIEAVKGTGIAAAMTSVLPEHMPQRYGLQLIKSGIAPLQGLPEAMRAVHHAVVWAETQRAFAGRETDILGLPNPAADSGRVSLEDEHSSKAALVRFGLRVPESRNVVPSEAPKAASAIGFPVVVKAVAPVIAHKASAGALALDLRNPTEVERAVSGIRDNLVRRGMTLERVLVERMVTDPALELIAGVKFDPRFGHALLFGRGGVDAEIIRDVHTALLPADEAVFDRLVVGTSIGSALSPTARSRVCDALSAIAAYVAANRDEVVSLDVNPLIVTRSDEVVAVDALLEIRGREAVLS